MNEQFRDQALRLLQESQLTGKQLNRFLQNASDPGFWKILNPQLSLHGTSDVSAIVDPAEFSNAVADFQQNGFFALQNALPASLMQRMKTCVERLVAENWHPVFAYIYDEFWQVPRQKPFVEFLSKLLGVDYFQTPDLWVHFVGAHYGASGWPPHMDNPAQRNRITMWVALTDATLQNGCMYVIPRMKMPEGLVEQWYQISAFDRRSVMQLLHAARPLPVQAGSVLGWDSFLVHWGSHRTDVGTPRISFSMEFSACNPNEDHRLLLGEVPDFRERLRIVANAILQYQNHEPRAIRYAELAKRLLQEIV